MLQPEHTVNQKEFIDMFVLHSLSRDCKIRKKCDLYFYFLIHLLMCMYIQQVSLNCYNMDRTISNVKRDIKIKMLVVPVNVLII